MASPPQANITGFLYKGAGQGLQYLRDLSTEKTRAAIGRMSTMQGADLNNLASVLSDYNAARAANARPVAPQISALARALLAGPSNPARASSVEP